MKRSFFAFLTVLSLMFSLCACGAGGNVSPDPSTPVGPTDPGTPENPTDPNAPTESPVAQYTLTFDTGSEAEIPEMVLQEGEIPTMPQTPTATDAVFAGWYFDSAFTDRYFFDTPLYADTTLYAKFYDTSLDEYIVISNVDQFKAIKNDTSANYLLACDINCKGESLSAISSFSGELDGNGYKLFNFALTKDTSKLALFETNKGTIKNLSFSDFVFDVLYSGSYDAYYGIVCGENTGTIDNCHILDSEIKITHSDYYDLYFGGIAGKNTGTISNCTNNAKCNLQTSLGRNGYWNYIHIGGIAGKNTGTISNCVNNAPWNLQTSVTSGYNYVQIGGIAGYNGSSSIVENCVNKGAINITRSYTTSSSSTGKMYTGGIIGDNMGSIVGSQNLGDISITCAKGSTKYNLLYTGGLVGYNSGSAENSYTQGKLSVANSDSCAPGYLGGFVGYNKGKVYNCYSAMDISHSGKALKAVGSFAGTNVQESSYESLINKCFATGNITLKETPAAVGYFIGNSTGTVKDCYYLDTLTIPVKPTNEIGTAIEAGSLLTIDFIEKTLYFDRTVWFLQDGKLPELK